MKICKDNDYIETLSVYGYYQVFNCKVASLNMFNDINKGDELTRYISWKPCTFHHYITHKSPFK